MAVLQRAKSTIYGLVADLQTLTTSISNEVSRAKGVEGTLDDLNTAVKTNLVAAINSLYSDVSGMDAANDSDLQAEIVRALAAEGVLQGNIDEEESARIEAVANLDSDLSAAIAAEEAARIADVANLDSDLTAAIAAEEASRIADVADLQGQITSNDGDIATLRTDLTSETNSRVAADSDLQAQINNILSNTDEAALDSLTEIVVAFQSADSDMDYAITTLAAERTAALAAARVEIDSDLNALQVQITSNDGDISTLFAQDSAESVARIAADGVLQGNIDAEEASRIAGDSDLNVAILAEESARILAIANLDSDLSAAISAEESARIEAVSNLDSDLSAAIAALDADTYSMVETDEAIRLGGAIFTTEVLVVSGDTINLTHEPKNGVIFNFATVRYTDENFVSYDVPVTISEGTTYTLHGNTSGQFDGESVTVQYAYVPAV